MLQSDVVRRRGDPPNLHRRPIFHPQLLVIFESNHRILVSTSRIILGFLESIRVAKCGATLCQVCFQDLQYRYIKRL